eukprot:CAMPEP_0119405704 /NCGR_PEP_ID=MMETSP1335-20130426/311_1 /TAXON_ID=259385 /ORGANISM="Chrysoculter rhomboideus, Strain RCC1486" /LENGTH=70 /DNA_ID=CAMNT_0007429741 /DNA_START=456 /DNA_END=668 /DNA_ORIENTATION=+
MASLLSRRDVIAASRDAGDSLTKGVQGPQLPVKIRADAQSAAGSALASAPRLPPTAWARRHLVDVAKLIT